MQQAPDELVELGRIASAYGVKGWVKVIPHASQSDSLKQAKVWWLKAPLPVKKAGAFSSLKAYPVVSARQHGATVVAQLEGVADRDIAHALKAYTVWLARDDFAQIQADEFYWVDLIDCDFYAESDGQSLCIGRVAEVFDNGAHAVLVIHRGNVDSAGVFTPMLDEKERPLEELVPFVEAVVHTVDLPARRLLSHWSA